MPAETPAVFDPEPLRRLESGSPGISKAVIEVYRRDLRAFMEAAPAILRGGDAEVMRRAAHKLKGSSGSIGARELQACALRLEAACRERGAAPPQDLDALIQAGVRFLELTTPH